jgi:hypothetical protein
MIGGIEMLRHLDFLQLVFGADFSPVRYRMLIFGLAMVLIMVWKPRGLIATREPSALLSDYPVASTVPVGPRSDVAEPPLVRGHRP